MKIPCDLAKDLMPLVNDNIASKSSTLLFEEHISECPDCKKLFEQQGYPDEKNNLPKVRKLKWILFTVIALLLAIGGAIGYFSSSAHTPMPAALFIVSILSLFPLAILLGKGKPEGMSRFFYGKAVGTVILFVVLGIYFLLHYGFGLFK